MIPKVLFAWPPEISQIPFFSLQSYHYAHFGETADYIRGLYETKIMDGGAFNLELKDFAKEFCGDFNVLAVKNKIHNVPFVDILARLFKEIRPKGKVITFGIASHYIPGYFEREPYDAVVDSGDWECGLRDYLDLLSGRKGAEAVRGLRLLRNGEFIRTGQGRRLDPQHWGYPPLDALPVEDYRRLSHRNEFTVSVSRGCPYPCPYCNIPLVFGRKDRRRPVDPLVDYLASTIERCDFDMVKFFTPTFTLRSRWGWIKDLCARIMERGLEFKFRFATRLDTLDEEIVGILQRAGCVSMALGVETIGDAAANIKKSMDLSLMERNIQLLLKYGIEPKALLMLGVPGQTGEEVEDTIRRLVRWGIKPTAIRPTAYSPYQDLTSDMSPLEITRYDRRTFYPEGGMEGLPRDRFLRLICNREKEIPEMVNQ